MSRALLLIIADFLLLSLLALARFDQPDEGSPPEEQVRLQEESAAEQDLFEMLNRCPRGAGRSNSPGTLWGRLGLTP